MIRLSRSSVYRPTIPAGALIAVACLAGILIGIATKGALAGWLAASVFVSCFPLGAASVLMTAHLSGGRWGRAISGYLEPMVATTPLLILLFVPLLIRSAHLYHWAHPDEKETLATIAYFRPGWVWVRSGIFLIFWAIGGPLLAGASRAIRLRHRAPIGLRRWCALGLVIHCFAITFASIDWIVSIEPEWQSSIFGMIVIAFQALMALAAATVAYAMDHRDRPADFRGFILRDLGNLMLTLVIFHAYVSFAQFFIIWNGNTPERTSWYGDRVSDGWLIVTIVMAAAVFAIPFFSFLFRALKRSPVGISVVCCVMLVGGAVQSIWLVVPSLHPKDPISIVWFCGSLVLLWPLWFLRARRPVHVLFSDKLSASPIT